MDTPTTDEATPVVEANPIVRYCGHDIPKSLADELTAAVKRQIQTHTEASAERRHQETLGTIRVFHAADMEHRRTFERLAKLSLASQMLFLAGLIGVLLVMASKI